MHMHIIVQCSGPSISQLVGSQSHFLFLFFSEPFLFLISSLFVPTLSMIHQSEHMSEHFERWVSHLFPCRVNHVVHPGGIWSRPTPLAFKP